MSALTQPQREQLRAAHAAAVQHEAATFAATQQAFARAHHALDDANWPTPEERSPEVLALVDAKTQARAEYMGALAYQGRLAALCALEGLL